MDEPIHPTYGTLDQLLAEIKANIIQGYVQRIGHDGALAWFAHEYGQRVQQEAATNDIPQAAIEVAATAILNREGMKVGNWEVFQQNYPAVAGLP